MKRGFLEACVLAAVSGEESYGYQIVKDVPASMGLTESTLYPLLKRLEKAGCITARSAEHNGAPAPVLTASRTPGASASLSFWPSGRPCRRSIGTWRRRTMTRDEFLNRLGELLACLPADQVEETKQFYAEAIADRMEDGMSEEEAVAAMGAPGEVAEATLDDLPGRAARHREDEAQKHRSSVGAHHRGVARVGAASDRLCHRGAQHLLLHLGAGILRVGHRGGVRRCGSGGICARCGGHCHLPRALCARDAGLRPCLYRGGTPRGRGGLGGLQADCAALGALGEKGRFTFLEEQGREKRWGRTRTDAPRSIGRSEHHDQC